MDALAVAASVIVGLVFVVAGGSKLAAGQRWPAEARGLGAPGPVVPVVPWVELVLGALLVTQVARPIGAAAALALLVAFTVLIAKRLHEGVHPPCACFGAWASKPLGRGHLVRNAVLIALAIVALT